MLNKLKNLFSGKDAAEDSTAKKSPSGYFTPSTGAELLALPHRKKLLKQLKKKKKPPFPTKNKNYCLTIKIRTFFVPGTKRTQKPKSTE